jgi:hypothetical protein
MVYQDLLHFTFDFGRLYTSTKIRLPTFTLLGFLVLIAVFLYAVALLEYYSNRDLMRGSRLDLNHPADSSAPSRRPGADLQGPAPAG